MLYHVTSCHVMHLYVNKPRHLLLSIAPLTVACTLAQIFASATPGTPSSVGAG